MVGLFSSTIPAASLALASRIRARSLVVPFWQCRARVFAGDQMPGEAGHLAL